MTGSVGIRFGFIGRFAKTSLVCNTCATFLHQQRLKPRSHLRMKSCECALIANVNGYSSICSVIRHSRTTENKSWIRSTCLQILLSQFIHTINSFMLTFIRRSQKFINTMLSILVMEGIVFVYIFKAISFPGSLNEYSQFACLQQLIRCFLFANVNESLRKKLGGLAHPLNFNYCKKLRSSGKCEVTENTNFLNFCNNISLYFS